MEFIKENSESGIDNKKQELIKDKPIEKKETEKYSGDVDNSEIKKNAEINEKDEKNADINHGEREIERIKKINESRKLIAEIPNDKLHEKTIQSKSESQISKEEINYLVENYLDDKEKANKNDFGEFVQKKIDEVVNKPISRRNFLKIAVGATAGLAVGYQYLKENIDSLWEEYQKEILRGYEIEYSKDMTELYEKVSSLPSKNAKTEDVNKNIDEIEKSFEFAKFIKNSEKQSIDALADDLVKKNVDVILFGETHGPESNAKNAVEVLEKLKNKSSKKITKLCLEVLDYKDSKSIELTEKFNQKNISAENFQKSLNLLENILPLLQFAQENNIRIEGLEDKEKTDPTKAQINEIEKNALDRFIVMTHKLGEVSKNKKEDEIIIAYSGSFHADMKQWDLTHVPNNYLSVMQPIDWNFKKFVESEDGAGKDYTFKEYLEKNGFKTIALHLKDMNSIPVGTDNTAGYTYNWLNNEDAEKIGKKWKEDWKNYETKQQLPFSVKLDDKENIYYIVNPGKISKSPPAINVFEAIRKNHPALHKIIKNKRYVDYQHERFGYDMTLAFYAKDSIYAKMSEIDLKSGKIKKIFLPEQEKNK